MAISQFTDKVKTHGLPRAVVYAAEYIMRPIWRRCWKEPVLHSYSQCAEDILIDRILGCPSTGLYVDVGACDPHVLSNTKRFYQRGWTGVNIEPEPERCGRFVRDRPRDINLNVGISDSGGSLTFFDLVPAELSTFSESHARALVQAGVQLKKEIPVQVLRLVDVFETHLRHRPIDFCTIDAEGLDVKVLRGNDWTRFRPRLVCVEVGLENTASAREGEQETAGQFLAGVGYRKLAETFEFGNLLNVIYGDPEAVGG